MKLFSVQAMLAVGVLVASIALLGGPHDDSARAQQMQAAPERPLVFVPGLLGSMLCRPGPDGEPAVLWGTLESMEQFPALAVAPGDGIEPCGLIREVSFLGIFTQTVYGPFIDRLEAAGYREGETLFVFDYDWRLSVLDNARRLAGYIDASVPGTGAVDIVAHSMGGLIARAYAQDGGGTRIARLVTAGAPWRGSVQVFQLLQEGMGFANVLIGGLDGFRRTVLSFPSTFELMPYYDGCCGSDDGATGFDAASAEAWAALHWPGIEAAALPDLAAAAARQQRLRAILGRPLPAHVEEALVIGVDQRTPERYELQPGEGEAHLIVRTSWEGDGTVMRDSALLAQQVTYPTSFATHDAILNDGPVQDFVIVALARGPRVALATVPVRVRTSILTALGELVDLVGVAIATDQPVYRTGSVAKLTVHLRLAVRDPVDATAMSVTIVRPDGTAMPVPLVPEPHASDPANPFEQSFSALLDTGVEPGELIVTVALAGGRTATRAVPILAP